MRNGSRANKQERQLESAHHLNFTEGNQVQSKALQIKGRKYSIERAQGGASRLPRSCAAPKQPKVPKSNMLGWSALPASFLFIRKFSQWETKSLHLNQRCDDNPSNGLCVSVCACVGGAAIGVWTHYIHVPENTSSCLPGEPFAEQLKAGF